MDPRGTGLRACHYLAHLIHHTSGLRDQWDLLALAGWRDGDLITEDDVLEMLKRQEALNFRPGDEYLYSNTGYTLLGVVVKRVTGVSLRRFADSVFFQPLGMNSTHFHSDHSEIVLNRTSAYVRDGDRWAIDIPVFDTYGATSLFTTVGDLAKWDANFYTAQIGGSAFIDAMLKPGVFNNGVLQNYASGLALGEYTGGESSSIRDRMRGTGEFPAFSGGAFFGDHPCESGGDQSGKSLPEGGGCFFAACQR